MSGHDPSLHSRVYSNTVSNFSVTVRRDEWLSEYPCKRGLCSVPGQRFGPSVIAFVHLRAVFILGCKLHGYACGSTDVAVLGLSR